MVPTIVLKDGKPFLVLGAPGGSRIITAVLEVILNVIDFGMNIQDAGEAPRFRHTEQGLALESAFSADARAGLTSRGHRLIQSNGVWGGFQGIMIDPRTHVLMAGSDPRKDGMAAGW